MRLQILLIYYILSFLELNKKVVPNDNFKFGSERVNRRRIGGYSETMASHNSQIAGPYNKDATLITNKQIIEQTFTFYTEQYTYSL